jgi:hypothetical protein
VHSLYVRGQALPRSKAELGNQNRWYPNCDRCEGVAIKSRGSQRFDLAIQGSQGAFKNLAVARVDGSGQLLEDALPGQLQSLDPAVLRCLLRTHPGPGPLFVFRSFYLLRFHGLAFPASGHVDIIGRIGLPLS